MINGMKPANNCKQDTSNLLADKLDSPCGSKQVNFPKHAVFCAGQALFSSLLNDAECQMQ